jgi:hypothetical protein
MNNENDVGGWARLARWAVAVAVYLCGCVVVDMVMPDGADDSWACAVALAIAVAVFWLLKLKARKQQERRIDAAKLRAIWR